MPECSGARSPSSSSPRRLSSARSRASRTAPATAAPERVRRARKVVPTPRTDRSSSTLVFHPLKLLNGAQSRSDYGTGAPQYAVSAQGVVYFAGSLSAPKNQNLAAFVMPVGARPGYYDCFSIYSNSSQNVQVVGALAHLREREGLRAGAGHELLLLAVRDQLRRRLLAPRSVPQPMVFAPSRDSRMMSACPAC